MTREDFLAKLADALSARRKEERTHAAQVIDAAIPLFEELLRPMLEREWAGVKVFEALERLKARNGVT